MVGAARAEAARLLRDELGDIGIDVCEVVVGQYPHCLSSGGERLTFQDRWHQGMLDLDYVDDRVVKIVSIAMLLARSSLLRHLPGETEFAGSTEPCADVQGKCSVSSHDRARAK
jgi:hypothetical protein